MVAVVILETLDLGENLAHSDPRAIPADLDSAIPDQEAIKVTWVRKESLGQEAAEGTVDQKETPALRDLRETTEIQDPKENPGPEEQEEILEETVALVLREILA